MNSDPKDLKELLKSMNIEVRDEPVRTAPTPAMLAEAEKAQRGRHPYGLLHKEAYCLMVYQSKDRFITEYLWNSRDGVTPFIIRSSDGREMAHVRWGNDTFAPNHMVVVGDRIFTSLTLEKAKEIAQARVSANPKYAPTDPDELLEYLVELAKDIYHGGNAPDVVLIETQEQADEANNQVREVLGVEHKGTERHTIETRPQMRIPNGGRHG